jgi:Mrp family chromosome partitioning ATPase
MPPGIGDATLDLIRLVERIEFLIVTTPSQLAFETVKRLAGLLQTMNIGVIGVVENMKLAHSDTIQRETKTLGLAFIGEIPFDAGIEETIGKIDKLLDTAFAEKVKRLALKI